MPSHKPRLDSRRGPPPSREQWWRDVVAGRRRTWNAALTRAALSFAEWPYRAVVSARNAMFDHQWRRIAHAAVPVISVGNLTVGGTGKSPCVRWLAANLADRGHRPVILSRGYRAPNGQHNDEALELARRLPQIPHLQHPDRVRSAERAVHEHRADVLILDDGFQHRRLHRDLDIVLIDATQPWGYGHTLPRGLLREPCRALRRAQITVITRASRVDEAGVQSIVDRIQHIHPDMVVATAAELPLRFVQSDGNQLPLADIPQPILPFCGIGNPAAFWQTLASLNIPMKEMVAFPDHYHFDNNDLQFLAAAARNQNAAALVCTEKDLVKIDHRTIEGIPLWALRIDWQWLSGRETVEQLIREVAG